MTALAKCLVVLAGVFIFVMYNPFTFFLYVATLGAFGR